jgi:formylglycine-generating enzyme required for sulfatase activity
MKTGHYETHGDVEEWVWDDDPKPEPKKVTTSTAEAVVKPKKAPRKKAKK